MLERSDEGAVSRRYFSLDSLARLAGTGSPQRPAYTTRRGTAFTVELDPKLRDAFLAEAEALDRPATQLVRDFVRQRREARGHDAWFRAEVEQALREVDDPAGRRIPHEAVRSSWQRKRKELIARAGGQQREG
jgi:predicted transcriptional regulator